MTFMMMPTQPGASLPDAASVLILKCIKLTFRSLLLYIFTLLVIAVRPVTHNIAFIGLNTNRSFCRMPTACIIPSAVMMML